MENEYSSLITGIDGLVYQKSVPFRDKGEDRTVNMSSNLPKNITPSTYSKSEDNIVTFNLSPEMKTMYPQSTAKIGDKEVSVLSLEEPMQFNPGSVTSIEINWNDVYREYFTIKIAEKQDKPEPPTPVTKNYFYVENISNKSATFTITNIKSSGASFTSIEISEDGETWIPLELDNDKYSFEVTDKTYLRAVQTSWNYWTINSDKNFNVGGNIMSLLYSDNFEDKTGFPEGSEYNFSQLFNDAPLFSAKDLILPATTLSEWCYNGMFIGCMSLTEAPELPAITLTPNCYNSMFYGCTSLTEAPQLPATTLAEDCYNNMFWGCTSLTVAPELPATTLADGCYNGMFSGCTSLTSITISADDISAVSCTTDWVKNVPSIGVFHNNGTATYEKGSANGIPEGWIEAREGYCYVNLDIVVNGESDYVIALFNEQQETYSKPGIIEIASNSSLELRAYPTKDKSQFDGWYDINGNLISNKLVYQCSVTEDRTIVAQFKAMPAEECTVTINIDKCSNKDAIIVNGTMYESNISIDTTVGNTLTLIAIPDKPSSSFVGWFDGDKEMSLDQEVKLTVDGDINITARFSEYMAKTTISVNAFSENDQVTADGVVVDNKEGLVISTTPGSTISLIATPDEGSLFKEWYDDTNKTQLSAELSYTYTVGDYDVNISAVFKSNK